MIREKIDNNIWIYRIAGLLCVLFFLLILTNPLWADTITFKFKNPSFSGANTSAHYLTIDEQERKRRDELAEKIQSELEEIEREDCIFPLISPIDWKKKI